LLSQWIDRRLRLLWLRLRLRRLRLGLRRLRLGLCGCGDFGLIGVRSAATFGVCRQSLQRLQVLTLQIGTAIDAGLAHRNAILKLDTVAFEFRHRSRRVLHLVETPQRLAVYSQTARNKAFFCRMTGLAPVALQIGERAAIDDLLDLVDVSGTQVLAGEFLVAFALGLVG